MIIVILSLVIAIISWALLFKSEKIGWMFVHTTFAVLFSVSFLLSFGCFLFVKIPFFSELERQNMIEKRENIEFFLKNCDDSETKAWLISAIENYNSNVRLQKSCKNDLFLHDFAYDWADECDEIVIK